MIKRYGTVIYNLYVIVDRSWIYYHITETKEQTKPWTYRDESEEVQEELSNALLSDKRSKSFTFKFYLFHPPYSPDLVPSVYFIFLNLNKWPGEKRFTSNYF